MAILATDPLLPLDLILAAVITVDRRPPPVIDKGFSFFRGIS